MMTDLIAQRSDLYEPPENPVLVEVPRMRYLMADGSTEPGGAEFIRTVQALYAVASTLKYEQKASGMDFTIMPLEGFFDADDPEAFLHDGPEEWRWTLALRIPAQITPDHLNRAKVETADKEDAPTLGRIRLEDFEEGTAAQVMHIGGYDEERPTVEKLHAYIAEIGHVPRGRHHEIYLSDPSRVPMEEMRTIIRQPVG
jgi:hypothetical protein